MVKWYILPCVYFTSIYKNKWRKRLKNKREKEEATNIIDSQKVSEKEKRQENKHNTKIQENFPETEKENWNNMLEECTYLRILTQNNQYLHII